MTTGATAADIVIVGGGIYGTSLAFELGSRGYSVILLEAHEIASGASGGPGERGVRANGRDIRELPIIAQALERWQKFESEIEGGVGYRRVGHLQQYIGCRYGQYGRNGMGKEINRFPDCPHRYSSGSSGWRGSLLILSKS